MTRKHSRFAAVLASAAALSMTATPALAQGWGWGGGWDGWGRRHHRDRTNAGDIIAGILIIGGIAAIASAASNSNKKDRRRDQDRRYPDEQYPRDPNAGYGQDNRPEWRERSGSNNSSAGGGIDSAVNACIDEVARGSARVDGVENVNREGQGWRVRGRTIKGGEFVCSVDGSGRVSEVSVDGKAY